MATVINPLWIGAYSTFFVIQGTTGDIIQARGFDRWSKPIPDYLRPSPAWIHAIYAWYALPESEREKYNEYAETTGYSGFQFYVLDYVNLEEEPSTLPPVTMPVHLQGDLDDQYTEAPYISLWWWVSGDSQELQNIRRWAVYKKQTPVPPFDYNNLLKVVASDPVINPLTGYYHQLLLKDYEVYDQNTYYYIIRACNRFSEQSANSNVVAIPFLNR